MMKMQLDWQGAPALAALTVLATAVPASAAPPNAYDPRSYAFASGAGSVGRSTTQINNGIVGTTFNQGPAPVISTSSSADGWINSATVVTDIGNSVTATANLHTGTAKAVATNGAFGTPRGIAEARINDTVFFNNTSGSTAFLPLSYRFDGSIRNTPIGAATASFSIGLARGCTDLSYTSCGGDSLALQGGGNANMTITIGYLGNGSANGVQQGGAFFFGAPDNVDLTNYTITRDWNTLTGDYDTIVTSVLVLPTGASRMGFDLRLSIDCWVELLAVCDFGHTSAVGFGTMPQGLSYTSGSGVFLAGDPTGGGVPEPASWAMLMAGFGLVGATMRKRRMRSVAA